jgi:hypothetical protein
MTMVLEHVAGQGGEGTPGRGARNMLTVCYDGLRTDLTTQHTYVYRTLVCARVLGYDEAARGRRRRRRSCNAKCIHVG